MKYYFPILTIVLLVIFGCNRELEDKYTIEPVIEVFPQDLHGNWQVKTINDKIPIDIEDYDKDVINSVEITIRFNEDNSWNSEHIIKGVLNNPPIPPADIMVVSKASGTWTLELITSELSFDNIQRDIMVTTNPPDYFQNFGTTTKVIEDEYSTKILVNDFTLNTYKVEITIDSGTDHINNLQLLCATCNSTKGTGCTAYSFLDHSLKEDCATITISLKGVSNGETQKIHP